MGYKKVDANQAAVVEGLRKCGFSVVVTSMIGDGMADLIVARAGVNILVELKNEKMPPNKRKLTPDEEAFHATWKGKIIIAMNLEEIINAFNVN